MFMRKLFKEFDKRVERSSRSVEQFKKVQTELTEENEYLSNMMRDVGEEISQLEDLEGRGYALISENEKIITKIQDFIQGGK